MSSLKAVVAATAFALSACSNQASSSQPSPPVSTTPAPAATGFALTSPDLNGGHWPADATCDGADGPPDLHWTAGPPATASYAIQVVDSDAPNGGFAHWMLANEPPTLRGPTPRTGVSGKNDFGNEGYNGPCPPHGAVHHYMATAYAVDSILDLQPLYSHVQFQAALAGHILAESALTATYGR